METVCMQTSSSETQLSVGDKAEHSSHETAQESPDPLLLAQKNSEQPVQELQIGNDSRKRGRPPGRSKRSTTLLSSSSYHTSEMNGITDWRTLTKDEILRRINSLPKGVEPYDILRAPRVLKGNIDELLNRKARLSNTGLTEDLSCPICKGTYQNVAVVKDCLHRFCEECIERWLRTGHQDCPQCRNKIPSRRSLRADPIFQQIVQRLFPDVESFERMNDRAVAAINERKTGLSESVFYREDKGQSRPSRRMNQRNTRVQPSADHSSPEPSTIKITLVPDPTQPDLKRLSDVKLAPLRVISLNQLKMMIAVSSGLNRNISFELKTSEDADALPMTLKVGEILSGKNTQSLTLYVKRANEEHQSSTASLIQIQSVDPESQQFIKTTQGGAEVLSSASESKDNAQSSDHGITPTRSKRKRSQSSEENDGEEAIPKKMPTRSTRRNTNLENQDQITSAIVTNGQIPSMSAAVRGCL